MHLEEANARVTEALSHARDCVRAAVDAWRDVEDAEQLLAHLPDTPPAERDIALRGVGAARVTIAVLRQLEG